MYGADVDELRALAQRLDQAADRCRSIETHLSAVVHVVEWPGLDGEEFRSAWRGAHRRSLLHVAQCLLDAAERIRSNAEEQERTSRGDPGGRPAGPFGPPVVSRSIDYGRVARGVIEVQAALDTGGLGVTASDLDHIRNTFAAMTPEERRLAFDQLSPAEVQVLRDQMQEGRFKGGWSSEEQRDFLQMMLPVISEESIKALMGEDWAKVNDEQAFAPAFDNDRDWVGSLFDHMRGEADMPGGVRLPGMSSDEIEVRQLANGRYIVVLPGVTDLTGGLDALKDNAGPLIGVAGRSPAAAAAVAAGSILYEWEGTNDANSSRDMHYARQSEMNSVNGSVDGANGYAFSVKEAMRSAGVPDGADVMLVGHSFGAYTAAELATDPAFNDAMGGTDTGYSVNVTHVMAGGGSVAFRMNDLPSGTRGLLVNNSYDVPYLSERSLPGNNADSSSEVVFNGSDFPDRSGRTNDGAGHQPTNYGAFVRETAHPDVQAFRESAFDGYGGPGDAIRVTVKDPYRLPTN